MTWISGRRWNAMTFPRSLATLIAIGGALSAARVSAQTASLPAANVAERTPAPRMLVARDPETGGWTLAPMEAKSVALSLEAEMVLNQSHAGLYEEALAGGGVAVNLQGRFQSYSMARREVDGTVQLGCTESPVSLFEWLTQEPVELDRFGRPVK